jgi:hypothetical protein
MVVTSSSPTRASTSTAAPRPSGVRSRACGSTRSTPSGRWRRSSSKGAVREGPPHPPHKCSLQRLPRSRVPPHLLACLTSFVPPEPCAGCPPARKAGICARCNVVASLRASTGATVEMGAQFSTHGQASPAEIVEHPVEPRVPTRTLTGPLFPSNNCGYTRCLPCTWPLPVARAWQRQAWQRRAGSTPLPAPKSLRRKQRTQASRCAGLHTYLDRVHRLRAFSQLRVHTSDWLRSSWPA